MKLGQKQIMGIMIGALVLGYLGGAIGSMHFGPGGEGTTVVENRTVNESSEMIEAIAKVRPAVVSVAATKDLQIVRQSPFNLFFGDPFSGGVQQPQQIETQRRQVSGGTGFIVQEDGLIITNRHVVLDQTADYSVIMQDGTEYRAEIVSLDPANDLAVVQIFEDDDQKPSGLPIIEFGDSDSLQAGQRVIAIGNALGEFKNTVTSGIISAVARQIEASDGNGGNRDVLSNLLQTDAAINSGNSGGPLINLSGQVIGVNTAVASNGNDIGFAIPANDVKPVFESVKEFGRIVRPQLGVRYVLLNDSRAEQYEIAVTNGALVIGNDDIGDFAVIPGSPADKAGLESGDVILTVNGKDLIGDIGLREAIRNLMPGDEVKMNVWRAGGVIEMIAQLEEFTPQQ